MRTQQRLGGRPRLGPLGKAGIVMVVVGILLMALGQWLEPDVDEFTPIEQMYLQRVADVDTTGSTQGNSYQELLDDGYEFCQILLTMDYRKAIGMDIIGNSLADHAAQRLAAGEVLCPENIRTAS